MKYIITTILVLSILTLVNGQTISGNTPVCADEYNTYTVHGDNGWYQVTWTIENGDIQESPQTGETIHAKFSDDGSLTAKLWYEPEPGHETVQFEFATIDVTVRKIGSVQLTTQACPFTLTRTAGFGIDDGTWQWQQSAHNANSWSTFSTTNNTSVTHNDVTSQTDFRLRSTTCATAMTSSVITVGPMPKPEVTISNAEIFSGGSFVIPTPSISSATTVITYSGSGVTGASNVTRTNASPVTQVLSTTALTASITYTITATKSGCSGTTKTPVVTVHRTPVITSTGTSAYKDRTITLSTDIISSATYQWRNDGGTLVGSSSSYVVTDQGKYNVTITKSGSSGVSTFFTVYGQFGTTNENYVLSRQPQKEFTSTVGFEDKLEDEITESIQYFDGLGRPVQNVGIRNSPNAHHDVVQPVAYDQFGRQTRKYLPYVSSEDNGRIQNNAITASQPAFYQQSDETIVNDTKPFSEIVYESSPLNRVLKEFAPGAAWQTGTTTHPVQREYLSNSTADSVLLLTYTIASGINLMDYYEAGTLVCNRTIDEGQNDVLEYIDKEGRMVCKRVKAATGIYASTYYIYDDFGNLVAVVPPEGVERITNPNGN